MTETFTAADVAAARAALALSRTELAAHLTVSLQTVDAWEDGRVSVPRRYARRLRLEVAQQEQQHALAAAGLSPCEWMGVWERRLAATPSQRVAKFLNELEPHMAGCERCRAREAYARDHLPPLPEMPVEGWLAALDWTSRRIDRLAPWARPAAWGAVILPAMTLFRAVIEIAVTGRLPSPVLAQALLLTAGIGAVLGGVYGGG